MKNPLLSVIIPVYNMGNTLGAALDSLLAQSFRDFEVVIINDGSTDTSEKVIKNYGQKFEHFQYLVQENRGVSVARNSGMNIAKGELIVFMDADDFLAPTYLEENLKLYDNEDVIITGITKIQEGKETRIIPNKTGTLNRKDFISDFVSVQLCKGIYGFVSNKFFKKNITAERGIYFNPELKLSEDLDFFVRYYPHCEKLKLTDSTGNFYSYTPKKGEVDYLLLIEVYRTMKEMLKNNSANTADIILLEKYLSDLKYAYFTEMQNISLKNISKGAAELSDIIFEKDSDFNRRFIRNSVESSDFLKLKNYLILRDIYLKIKRSFL